MFIGVIRQIKYNIVIFFTQLNKCVILVKYVVLFSCRKGTSKLNLDVPFKYILIFYLCAIIYSILLNKIIKIMLII